MPKHTKHNFRDAKAVTIDGIEGEYARVELPDGTTEDWSLAGMPEGVREDDVVNVGAAEGHFEMQIDHEETRSRRKKAEERLDEVNAEQPTGEIDL